MEGTRDQRCEVAPRAADDRRGSARLGIGSVTAACLPCGSALGATWDPTLVEEVGAVIGQEARTKSSRFLLAPTLNLHRSPIAGRNFECYAEDPLLAGKTAAGVELGASVADLRQRLEVSTTERRIGP